MHVALIIRLGIVRISPVATAIRVIEVVVVGIVASITAVGISVSVNITIHVAIRI